MNYIDLDYLRETTDGDAELEQELLHRFEATIARCLGTLNADISQASAALHELKGAAAAMGANPLADLCTMLEITPENLATQLPALTQLAQATLSSLKAVLYTHRN
jgi:HPt (histidine-containing phosphotransfer) domain-containing protein